MVLLDAKVSLKEGETYEGKGKLHDNCLPIPLKFRVKKVLATQVKVDIPRESIQVVLTEKGSVVYLYQSFDYRDHEKVYQLRVYDSVTDLANAILESNLNSFTASILTQLGVYDELFTEV